MSGRFACDSARAIAARELLSAAVMPIVPIAAADRDNVLRFAASFLWADLEVAPAEHVFFRDLARALGAEEPELLALDDVLCRPPAPAEIDPTRVPVELADTVRDVALRAIAADGRVDAREMELFDLLDELLPRKD